MTRHPRILRAPVGEFQAWLDSWRLSLEASGLSQNTRNGYVDVGALLGGWLRTEAPAVGDWDQVGVDDLRRFFAWIQACGSPCPHVLGGAAKAPARCEGYGKGYANNIGRGLQQFFAWLANEEDIPNVMQDVRIPVATKTGDHLIPILDEDALRALINHAESERDYPARRDAALLRMFACTGVRLAELAGIQIDDVNMSKNEATVTGKGDRQRIVKFNNRAALALDRYMRMRRKRIQDDPRRMTAAATTALWIGYRRFMPMTTSGIYQVIARRGELLGIHLHPHMFRHTFAHRWLDAGGAEGDLMELAGWDSPQMLAHYGRSARGARARRSYDGVNVMGDM
jgi:integrase/recombinase XerD